MCFMFGCCGPPPFATIKAYNNTTPFALDWYDDRDGGAGGIRETAIIDWNDETGYTTGVLSVGDGAEVTGSTNEKAVVERDADDGDRQTESASSPETSPDTYGGSTTLIKSATLSGPSGGVWLGRWQTGGKAAFFDLDLVQQGSFSFPSSSANPDSGYSGSFGTNASQNCVIGVHSGGFTSHIHNQTWERCVAREFNTSGVFVAELLRSAVLDYPNSSVHITLVPRPDTSSKFLVASNSNNQRRNLYVCDKDSMSLTSTGTEIPWLGSTYPAGYHITDDVLEYGKASRINSTHAILHIAGTHSGVLQPIVCIDMSTPQELWVATDKRRRFVALDSTQVYTLDPTAGELSAVLLSSGVEQWTLDLSAETKLGTGNGQVYGAVLSTGNIAVWRNAGVTIVSTSGTEVATVDVGPCYGIVEKSSRWIIVGGKRTTSA